MAIVKDQMVEVKWNKNNYTYYESLGFTCNEKHKTITVPVAQLPEKSNATIHLLCDACGKKYSQKYRFVSNRKNHFCCKECYTKYRQLNGSHNNTSVEVSCGYCGINFKIPQYRYTLLADKKVPSVTCSRSCQNRLKGLSNRGKNHPNYKGSIEVTCQTCNIVFDVAYHRESTAKYCSVKCQRIGVGKQNIPVKKIEVNCYTCGKQHEKWEYEYKKFKYHFCSNSCKNESNGVLISMQKGNFNTKIQIRVNEILTNLGIVFENEKAFGKYCVDNYLPNYNLAIEVMGDYWHSSPLKYTEYSSLNDMQTNRVRLDKAKRTFLHNQHNVKVLYLWESDLLNNLELCASLIKLYIESPNELSDYNSFNYIYNDSSVKLTNVIIKPYFLRKNTTRQTQNYS